MRESAHAAEKRKEREALGLREGMMFRASLSAARKMRHLSAASAEAPANFGQDERRLAIDLAISTVFGVDAEGLWHGTRGVRDIAEARQVAMYLAHVCCGMTLTEVGAMFGRDRTTVSHACLKVEYRRDDPNFDRALDLLSWALPTLVLRVPSRDRLRASTRSGEHEWL